MIAADQISERADICIGADPFHTPLLIRNAIVSAAKEERYSVAMDAPFAGALVPLASYRKDKRIMSVMIEVNRLAIFTLSIRVRLDP